MPKAMALLLWTLSLLLSLSKWWCLSWMAIFHAFMEVVVKLFKPWSSLKKEYNSANSIRVIPQNASENSKLWTNIIKKTKGVKKVLFAYVNKKQKLAEIIHSKVTTKLLLSWKKRVDLMGRNFHARGQQKTLECLKPKVQQIGYLRPLLHNICRIQTKMSGLFGVEIFLPFWLRFSRDWTLNNRMVGSAILWLGMLRHGSFISDGLVRYTSLTPGASKMYRGLKM